MYATDIRQTDSIGGSKVNLQGRGHIVAATRTACSIRWMFLLLLSAETLRHLRYDVAVRFLLNR